MHLDLRFGFQTLAEQNNDHANYRQSNSTRGDL